MLPVASQGYRISSYTSHVEFPMFHLHSTTNNITEMYNLSNCNRGTRTRASMSFSVNESNKIVNPFLGYNLTLKQINKKFLKYIFNSSVSVL